MKYTARDMMDFAQWLPMARRSVEVFHFKADTWSIRRWLTYWTKSYKEATDVK